MPRSRVTIRDVAALAGVSHQTVSRVINDSGLVHPATRSRVEAAIDQLGFSPNAIARFMARGRTGALACFAPNLLDYTFASIIEAAQIEARQHGFFLLSASAPDAAAFAELLAQLIDGQQAEGLMIINPYADERHTLIPTDLPVVFAGARPRAGGASSVALDDVEAARLATQHLLDLGHRAIGMITGPMTEDCSQDRREGFEQTLRAAGLTPDSDWIVEGDWLAPSGYGAFGRLMAGVHRPSAIFVQNDQMAIGLLRAARDAGLALPTQLSVVGVDDIPLVAYVEPPLTTVRQDFAAIGRQAARCLIQALEEPATARLQMRLSAKLIIRHSTHPHALQEAAEPPPIPTAHTP